MWEISFLRSPKFLCLMGYEGWKHLSLRIWNTLIFRFNIAIEMSVLLMPGALNVIISLSLKVFRMFSSFFVMSFLSVMKFHFHISCCEVCFFPHPFYLAFNTPSQSGNSYPLVLNSFLELKKNHFLFWNIYLVGRGSSWIGFLIIFSLLKKKIATSWEISSLYLPTHI